MADKGREQEGALGGSRFAGLLARRGSGLMRLLPVWLMVALTVEI